MGINFDLLLFSRFSNICVAILFLAAADRVGRVEKLCGRLMLATWQDKRTPSNTFYFVSKGKNMLCFDSKGFLLQKTEKSISTAASSVFSSYVVRNTKLKYWVGKKLIHFLLFYLMGKSE